MSSAPKRPPECDPKARFRGAKRHIDFTIDQEWSAYTPAEHDRWDRLFKRSEAVLCNRACGEFLAMLQKLELSQSGIPDMEKLSERLAKLTGWRVVPVLELIPDDIFFDHLANRRFPAGAAAVRQPIVDSSQGHGDAAQRRRHLTARVCPAGLRADRAFRARRAAGQPRRPRARLLSQ